MIPGKGRQLCLLHSPNQPKRFPFLLASALLSRRLHPVVDTILSNVVVCHIYIIIFYPYICAHTHTHKCMYVYIYAYIHCTYVCVINIDGMMISVNLVTIVNSCICIVAISGSNHTLCCTLP